MKKMIKLAAFAMALVSFIVTGCNNLNGGTVSGSTSVDSRTITLGVSGSEKYLDFSGYTAPSANAASRSIIADAEQIGNLWFYLVYQDISTVSKAAAGYSTPHWVKVTPKDNGDGTYSDSEGEVIIDLKKSDYNFVLYAVPKAEGETTHPDYDTEAEVKAVASLIGKAQADIRYNNDVNFFMQPEGLSAKGNIDLTLYACGDASNDLAWDPNDGEYLNYSATAQLTYTKDMVGGASEGDVYTDSDVVLKTEKTASTIFIKATETEASADGFAGKSNYKITGIDPGTYNLEVVFTKTKDDGSKLSFTWSDKIVVLPNRTTEDVIEIARVIEKIPDAPGYLHAGYYKDYATSSYYAAEFVWDGNAITNEDYFQLQIANVDSPTVYEDSDLQTMAETAATAEAEATAADDPTKKNPVSKQIFALLDAAGTEPLYDYTYNFVGNEDTYFQNVVDDTTTSDTGSLARNNSFIICKLGYGKRYVARIRACNQAGESDWVYWETPLDSDSKPVGIEADVFDGVVAANPFTSCTINRFRMYYEYENGTTCLYDKDGADDAAKYTAFDIPETFYACQTFGDDDDDSVGTRVMDLDKEHEYFKEADISISEDTEKPVYAYLNSIEQFWTYWEASYSDVTEGRWNEIDEDQHAYTGYEDITFTAIYATVGKVKIFDDNNYTVGEVDSSNSLFTYDGSGYPVITLDQNPDETVTETWTVKAQDGIEYSAVKLEIFRTRGNDSVKKVHGVINADGDTEFTVPYDELTTGIYRAEIQAYTTIKQDPYTVEIYLNVVDTSTN